MHTIFVTGFPGFLATRLIPRLIADRNCAIRFILLVEESFRTVAETSLATIRAQHPQFAGEFELVCGDITQDLLGISQFSRHGEIDEIFHLAAVYDLAVAEDVGHRINVIGTTNTIAFAKACPNLARHHYISTCYVSGNRQGDIFENELEHQNGFKNFYEQTKYEAEVLVKASANDVPTTIYRPSIVVGSSETGETGKFDGPYFALKMLYRLPKYGITTILGKGDKPVNIVPWDFVVAAMSRLSQMESTTGMTFQLADPNPLSQKQLLQIFAEYLGKKLLAVPVPAGLGKKLLTSGLVQKRLRIVPELLDYFDHPHRYDATNTIEKLAGTGISCPHFADYAENIIGFFKNSMALKKQQKI